MRCAGSPTRLCPVWKDDCSGTRPEAGTAILRRAIREVGTVLTWAHPTTTRDGAQATDSILHNAQGGSCALSGSHLDNTYPRFTAATYADPLGYVTFSCLNFRLRLRAGFQLPHTLDYGTMLTSLLL
eukprot:8887561-Pyramimonas_sp.AAC.2